MAKPTLVSQVRDDLIYLDTSFTDRVGDAEVTRGSAVLRRLLVEGLLGLAWRSIGFAGEPEVQFFRFDLIKAEQPFFVKIFAQAVNRRGTTISGLALHVDRHLQSKGVHDATARLSAYLDGLSIFYNTRRCSRRQVIKYMSNRCGGVHFGLKETESKDKHAFEALEHAWETYYLSDVDDPAFDLSGELDAIHMAVLGIGQELSASPDIHRLRAAISGVASPE